ncbi:hypothetical protein, partial [Psychrobacter celer]|uniref:hypothetical protein n=1 Tax=Psychrobacter celer TaxID=306572 RepID=UPI003FCF277C
NYDLNGCGYQGIRNIVRQWLTPDIHVLEGRGFTALDNKINVLIGADDGLSTYFTGHRLVV